MKLIVLLVLFNVSVRAQFPSFLSAFTSGFQNKNKPRIDRQNSVGGINPPPPPPPVPPVPFSGGNNANLDSAFSVPGGNPAAAIGNFVSPAGNSGGFGSTPAGNFGGYGNNGGIITSATPVPPNIPPAVPSVSSFPPAQPLQNGFSSSPQDFGDDNLWPLQTPDLPKIQNIQVQCEKTAMRVSIDFDRPFSGMVFSKGHFSDPQCVHLQPGSGATSTVFEIKLNQCGMQSSGGLGIQNNGQPNPAGSYIDTTIIIQYDPLVQEVFDQARKLRCTWYDYYEKSVTFRPFQVNMLNVVTANFLGDNLQCWMQIQTGKGPWSSEVSGIVKIGQTMTMVLGIKDEENKFDMVVRNCVAHDGKRTPIQLVNEVGCVIRPKIMSKFNKIKNFGSSATVVSYAYFQAFKFPDSMNVHFQCVIQVCRFNCPDPVCPDDPNLVTPSSPSTPTSSTNFNSAPVIPTAGAPSFNPRTPNGGSNAPSRRVYRPGRRGRFGMVVNNQQQPQDQQNLNNQEALLQMQKTKLHNLYYQNYQNHRVRRFAEELDKVTVGTINTNSSVQVLSPDDVAFKLSTRRKVGGNETDESSIVNTNLEWKPDKTICVTLTDTSGILFLTFMSIIVASLISSAIITCRRRKSNSKVPAKTRHESGGKIQIQKVKHAPAAMPPKKVIATVDKLLQESGQHPFEKSQNGRKK